MECLIVGRGQCCYPRSGLTYTDPKRRRGTVRAGRVQTASQFSDGTVRGVEAGEVVVEDEVGERDGHRDIDPLDEMQAADRQEEDLARIEDEFQDLRLLEPRAAAQAA